MEIRRFGLSRQLPRVGAAFIAASLMLGACSADQDLGQAAEAPEDGGPVDGQPTAVPRPPDSEYRNTVAGACDGSEPVTVELAFSATIAHVDRDGAVPWFSFATDRWFTTSIGASVGMWGPGFEGKVGEQWLVGSTRYSDTLGDIILCQSEPFTQEGFEDWELRFGGSIDATSRVAEAPASPALLGLIDEAQARWRHAAPSDWTATIFLDHRTFDPAPACTPYPARIVVESGQVVQAVNLQRGCAIAPGDVPTMELLFDEARRSAGAVDGDPDFDDEFGFVRSFHALDRTVEVNIFVENFFPRALPLALTDQEHDEARARWSGLELVDYDAEVTSSCFCADAGTFEVSVRAGRVISITGTDGDGREPRDPASFTVDAIFEQIEAARRSGRVAVAYDPETGHPVTAFLDRLVNAIDDEGDFSIVNLTPV